MRYERYEGEFQNGFDDSLMHYGVKGMKWGVRRNKRRKAKGYAHLSDDEMQKVVKRKNLEKSYAKATQKGATYDDKKNAKNDIVSNTNNISSNVSNLNRTLKGLSNTPKIDLSHMSDAELRSKINRMDMERRYSELSSNNKKRGMDYVTDTLSVVSNVVGIAGGAVGIALAVKQFKEKAG